MRSTNGPTSPYRVAIVFPADPDLRRKTRLEDSRFARTAAALAEKGIAVEGAPYVADDVERLREQLMRVDGVLVWINPIVDGRDRTDLNKVLADVAASGVFVSAHPDVIAKMGTKDVLFRTRAMGWGCDTRHYPTFAAMQRELLESLATGEARVLKRARGQSGDGVWKVELADRATGTASAVSPQTGVRVRHAKRGSLETTMSLAAFIARCEPYFAPGDGMIDQIYQRRLPEGMVRCYLVRDRVAGFGEQKVNALYPAEPGAPANSAPQPDPRLYYPPTRADFQRLKGRLEREWLDQLCDIVGVEKAQLPILWDADFLYGEKDSDGADIYVLCEINVSSVYPFPDDALGPLAAETLAQIGRLR
ncbi:MAG TPA: Cj0069 family protein [Hyphomicrobiaceae bacterium]|nr:Cj0069 family protein [Hyphomicrobiaceae bacterium]